MSEALAPAVEDAGVTSAEAIIADRRAAGTGPGAGPWWVTSFAWNNRTVSIRFRLARIGDSYRPTRIEQLTSAYPTPTRAVKRTAVAGFVRKNRATIDLAYDSARAGR